MSEHTGFIRGPLDDIARLRNDLGDRYRQGFPILKELIQNADDARATRVVFGLAPPVPAATHPLLQGRGLFLVNNGAFEPKHDRGIRRYGTSHKATDEATIGKFGLGMKSVFHLCEAFFYLAHLPEQGPVARIVNPWSVPDGQDFEPIHPHWGPLTPADAAALRLSLAPVLADLPTPLSHGPFILWLPLRRDAHRWEAGRETGVIVHEFPGDDDRHLAFLLAPGLADQLAELLPLLRWVNRIERRILTPEDPPDFRVGLNPEAPRLRFAEPVARGPIRGLIQREGQADRPVPMQFVSQESSHWSADLEGFRHSPNWPKHPVQDDLGKLTVEPEKAEPHAAVVLTARPAPPGQGRLTLRWAVFLPLDDSLVGETLDCGGDLDLCLTLHGYFFVDAGRRGIHGFAALGQGADEGAADATDEVRIGWNRALATRATLPLLLPVLDAFVADGPDDIGESITRAIQNSGLWKRFDRYIVADGHWVLRLTRDGQRWARIDAGLALLPLPRPRGAPALPWEVFPTLDRLADTVPVVADAPRLTLAVDSGPTAEQIATLLGGIDAPAVFGQRERLDYLNGSLALWQDAAQQPAIQHRLRELLRAALGALHLKGLRTHPPEVRQFIDRLPADAWLAVPGDLPEALLEGLACCPVGVLILPGDLAPTAQNAQARLTRADAEALLGQVAEWIEAVPARGRDTRVLDLVPTFTENLDQPARDILWNTLADRPLLRAFDGEVGRWQAVSPRTVQRAQANGLLFRRGPSDRDQGLGLARTLQSVLRDQRLVVLDREFLELLGVATREVRVCDGEGVLLALGSQMLTLREPGQRRDLLRQLPAPDPTDPLTIKGWRYLLHAHEGGWSDTNTPLWFRDSGQAAAAWERFWGQLNAGWNLVERTLAECIADANRDGLGLRCIRPRELLEAVAKHGTRSIDPTAFTTDECATILREARDEVVWRMLPLHDAIDGSRGDAREGVWLHTGLPLPAALAPTVRLLRRSTDEEVARQQRQRLLPFDHAARLRLLLASPQRADCASDILTDLGHLADPLPEDLRGSLTATAWLSDVNGALYRPEDVIDCPDPSGLVRDLARRAPAGTYTHESLLHGDLRAHPNFEELRTLLAQDDQALERLGLLAAELPEYHLGEIDTDPATLGRVLPALADLPDPVGLPGWRLLAQLAREHGEEQVLAQVARELALEPPQEAATIRRLFDWLRERGQADEGRRAAFELYLRRLAALPGAKQLLPELHLIDQGGHWRPAAELCATTDEIERRHVLCQSQREVLARLIVSANQLPDAGPAEPAGAAVSGPAMARLLEDFFQPWRGKVPDALIGCFVFLYALAPEVKQLVETYRGNRRAGLRDWLLDIYPWRIPGLRQGGTPNGLHFSARIVKDNRVVVSSILGRPLAVERARNATDFVTFGGRDNKFVLQLAPIDVGARTGAELEQLLQRSIAKLAQGWSGQAPPDDADLWRELRRSDQVSIEVARTLILEHLPVIAKQLPPDLPPALKRALRDCYDAGAAAVEFQQAGEAKRNEAGRKKDATRKALADLIETDATAQAGLLAAVREKVKGFQYQRDSIPFELFQNADDALCQRLEIESTARAEPVTADADSARFVIRGDAEALTFLHWGRAINAVGEPPFPGQERDFDRDLEHMLILNASAKEQPATGKFGLGFKSVFLACERPQLVSGRLALEIVGGMLPRPLADDGPLRALLQGAHPAGGGTAIRLDIGVQEQAAVLARFRPLAGVLCCFARAIRTIEADGENFHWESVALGDSGLIQTGWCRLPEDADEPTARRVLRLDLGDGALLLGLGAGGIERLPDAVPSFWRMAPTSECARLGFALNGPFVVDAGRSQLANNSPENGAVAERLGAGLRQALAALDDAMTADWDGVRQGLGLHGEPYDLWQSLWQALCGRARTADNRRDLLERLLRPGLGQLARERAVIPNGLPASSRCLLRTGEIRMVLRGALTLDAVLAPLSGWEPLIGTVAPGASIREDMHEQVAFVDADYASSRTRWSSKRLADLVSLARDAGLPEEAGVRLEPSDAAIWEQALAALDDTTLTAEQRKDQEDSVRALDGARFRNEEGRLVPAQELLDPAGGDAEEGMRCAFAPAAWRLSADYGDDGRKLLRRCRPRGYVVNPAQMAEWIRRSDDADRRRAAILYLREGEQAPKILLALRDQGLAGCWLQDLGDDSPYFEGWNGEQRKRLLLSLTPVDQIAFAYIPTPPPTPREVDVGASLRKLADWWQQHRTTAIREYERQVWPGGSAPVDALRRDAEDGTFDRGAWLMLFVLGHFHTLGLRPEQHRRFIEVCQQRRWWQDAFALPDPQQQPDKWMDVLDQYIDVHFDDEVYQHWMRSFPVIYRLARDLDRYRGLMRKLHLFPWSGDTCPIEQVTVSSESSVLSGGGEIAAACKRALGIGVNFVVRELFRLGLVDGDPLPHACAWVPTGAVRNLFTSWGFDEFSNTNADPALSPRIFEIVRAHLGVSDSLFGGDYDLALQRLAYDDALRFTMIVYKS